MTTGEEPSVVVDPSNNGVTAMPLPQRIDPPIPVVQPPRPVDPETITARQLSALDTGLVKHGNQWTRDLHDRLAATLDVDAAHVALATVSGTAALRLAVAATAGRARPGEVAVLPSYTFAATAEVLLQLGYELRYADVDAQSWTIDPVSVQKAIDQGRVRLVVAVDTFGNPCDYPALRRLCDTAGVVLVADSAAALGSTHHGRAVSQLADAHAYSMSFAKVLSAGGAGGAVVLATEAAGRLESDPAGWTRSELISELHAIVALDQILVLPDLVRARQLVAKQYADVVAGYRDVHCQQVARYDEHSYVHWVMRVGRRDEIQAALAAFGVLTKPYFPALHRTSHPAASVDLTVTETLHREALALPMSSEFSAGDAARIADVVGYVLARRD